MRHGQVENPKGVIYGRLPGYHLSERGHRQAEASAEHLAERDIGIVRASPMERTQETAGIVAAPHGLEVETDERIIESLSKFEGVGRRLLSFISTPERLWSLRNPLQPSWGEPFSEIKARMLAAINDAISDAGGKEIVVVSHQTPVLVARLALARRRVPPWLGFTPCETGSVTSLEMDGDTLVSAEYFVPLV